MGLNDRDRGKRSVGGLFHIRGGSVGFGTALTNSGKGDVILYRSSADNLSLDVGDSFRIQEDLNLGTGGTKLVVSAGGTITWSGLGSKANLYWVSNQLKTDDELCAIDNVRLGSGGTKVVVSAGGTITFREDANLYWSAAGILKSDGALRSATNVITRDAGGTAPLGILATAGAIVVGNLGGTPRIFANVAGTVYQFNGTGL